MLERVCRADASVDHGGTVLRDNIRCAFSSEGSVPAARDDGMLLRRHLCID